MGRRAVLDSLVREPVASRALMISVTVPICNEAGAIPELHERVRAALDGVVGQPWELVFVNDGSTDGSEALLDKIAADDPRVKVVHFRRNFGQTAAFAAGFDHARGRYIVSQIGRAHV